MAEPVIWHIPKRQPIRTWASSIVPRSNIDMPAQEIGSLAQAVLNAYNNLSRLRQSGAGPVAIRAATQLLKQAQLAQQAATGSQQGLGTVAGATASRFMPAFGPPQISLEQGIALGNKGGTAAQGTPMNFGPIGRLFASILPSVFGQSGLRAPTSFAPTGIQTPASIRDRQLSAPNSFFPTRTGVRAPTEPAPLPGQRVSRLPKFPNRRY